MSVLRDAVDAQGRSEIDRLDRRLASLSIIGEIAPLLGLLGALMGFMKAVMAANAAEIATRPELMDATMEALVPAAMGLAIAIPVAVMHGSLRNRVDRIVTELETVATAIVGHIASQEGAALGNVHAGDDDVHMAVHKARQDAPARQVDDPVRRLADFCRNPGNPFPVQQDVAHPGIRSGTVVDFRVFQKLFHPDPLSLYPYFPLPDYIIPGYLPQIPGKKGSSAVCAGDPAGSWGSSTLCVGGTAEQIDHRCGNL